jgi:aminopeptidase N
MAPQRLLLLALLGACASDRSGAERRELPMDPHSHAQPDRVRVTHVDLDLELDFAAQRVAGTARLQLERRDGAAPLVLDQQGLAIAAVRGSDGGARAFTLGEEHDGLGSALEVRLASADSSVEIDYATTERADALQWLEPSQTASGRAPFLFTQGQAVLTRTWIPLQDSPQVRVTYAARVRAPAGLRVLMSAEQLGADGDGAFRFRLRQPVPPYLIALACGELDFRPISARAGVWAEPPIVGRAASEFDDTETMIQAAEQLFGPYRWGRYDLLFLPPSFPFGGMENPLLTFATPTALAGDKSLVSLAAHELAHSWSGNLVTNATWRDFWLNEGFTVYFENRIMERVYGVDRARTELQLARSQLERQMRELEPWKQVLHVDLGGRHPDDGYSEVPYTKGSLFLVRIEELVGREAFDRFLRAWFDQHAFQSVTTATFLEFLQRELLAQLPDAAAALDLDAWLNQPGLPPDAPAPRGELMAAADREAERWKATRDATALDTAGWITHQWLHFFEAIESELDAPAMAGLDARFALTHSGNAEILCGWLRLAIQCGYAPAEPALEEFLGSVGRRKFLEPLYKALCKTDAGRARANELYERFRPRYHAVSAKTLDEVLGRSG